MLKDDEHEGERHTHDGDALPEMGPDVVPELVNCRKKYQELEGEYERELVTHNDALYQLAARIFGLASRLFNNTNRSGKDLSNHRIDWSESDPGHATKNRHSSTRSGSCFRYRHHDKRAVIGP